MSHENDPIQPEKLADALRAAYTHRPAVPPIRDQFIRVSAQAHFARRRIVRQMIAWGSTVAAGLAAAIALIVFLNRPESQPTLAKGDINADGQVNIVDALALARHLNNHDTTSKAWDYNSDGVIDQKDVNAIAHSAVTLKPAQATLPTLNQLGLTRPPIAPGLPGEALGSYATAQTTKETPQ